MQLIRPPASQRHFMPTILVTQDIRYGCDELRLVCHGRGYLQTWSESPTRRGSDLILALAFQNPSVYYLAPSPA